MQTLVLNHLADFADSKVHYKRGEALFRTGALRCIDHLPEENRLSTK